MKFNLQHKEHKAISVAYNQEDAYYIKEQNIVKASQNEIIENINENIEGIFFYSEMLLLLDDLNKIVMIYDLNKHCFNKTLLNHNDIRVLRVDSDYIIYYKKTDPRTYGLLTSDQILFSTTNSIGYLYKNENKIFNATPYCIGLFKNQNTFLWQHDLIHLGTQPGWTDNRQDKFYKFLGVVKDNLFVLSEAGRIVVLDVNTGTLIKVIHSEEFPRMWDAFLHPDNHTIYCLSNRFVKINTQTLEIETIKSIVEENRDPNFNTILYGIKNSSFQGEYISFTSFTRHRSGFAKYIGLFDYKSEQIVWHYELLPEEGQLSIPAGETPQLAGNNLYVLDSNNTLYILKRDD